MNHISADVHESAGSMVMGLTLNQLKQVCRHNGLGVSGPKATLQTRIREQLAKYARGDQTAFFQLRYLLEHPDETPPSRAVFGRVQSPSASMNRYSSEQSQPPLPSSTSNGQLSPVWKRSPLHDILQSVTPVQECKVREQTRDSFECKIRLTQDIIDKFSKTGSGEYRADCDLRFMIYCAAEPVSTVSASEIAFPQSIEIRVNGNEVKRNLRGLKNKPGSTLPADITEFIHRRPNYTNILTVTYALTNKRFYLVVNLVKPIPPEALVEQLKRRMRLSKDQVIRDMAAKAQDSDIQATSSIMSLKCPLSTLRMSVPCRSRNCSHNQCYDALSFLQLQTQAPTWTCPVCSKHASWESIHIDGYVSDILDSSSRSVEQVAIEPSGEWKPVSAESIPGQGPTSESDDPGDDDDLVEIQEPSRAAPPAPLRTNVPWTPSSTTRTPPASSREQSITSASVRSSGSKRSASAVIDLTFSSDDEEPPRPAKRQSLNQPPSQSAYPFSSTDQRSSETDRANGISFSMQRGSGYPMYTSQNPLGR